MGGCVRVSVCKYIRGCEHECGCAGVSVHVSSFTHQRRFLAPWVVGFRFLAAPSLRLAGPGDHVWRRGAGGLRLGLGWAAAPQGPGPALHQEAHWASRSFCLAVSQWMVLFSLIDSRFGGGSLQLSCLRGGCGQKLWPLLPEAEAGRSPGRAAGRAGPVTCCVCACVTGMREHAGVFSCMFSSR